MPAETHVEQGPLDRQGVFELVRDRLADIPRGGAVHDQRGRLLCRRPRRRLLALIELVEALEEELSERSAGFRIDDEDQKT